MLGDAHPRKTINYIQRVENYVLSVGNVFLFLFISSHSHAIWPNNGLNKRIWSKIRFSPLKLADFISFIGFSVTHIT